MSISKKVKVWCAASVFLAALGWSGSTFAEEFRVNLVATIDDDPAMENVEWTVYRNGSEEYKKARKHSTHVNVPPGIYKVVARLKSDNRTVVRSRNFHVRNDTMVVVAMD